MTKADLPQSEFFEQLALLTQAQLPLPQSLGELAKASPGRLRRLAGELAQATADGRPLAEAMQQHGSFSDYQVQLVRTGETSGVLPEMLAEVARQARHERDLVDRLRAAAMQPALTLWVALVVVALLLRFFVPRVLEDTVDMLPAASWPWLTLTLYDVSQAVTRVWPGVVILLAAVPLFFLWLLAGGPVADRLLHGVLLRLPVVRGGVALLDHARLAGLLGVYVRRAVPLQDALAHASEMLRNRKLQARVRGWARAIGRGQSVSEAIDSGGPGPSVLRLTLAHAPEDRLADELHRVAELQESRGQRHLARGVMVWQVALYALVVLVVFGVGLGLFGPYLQMIERLSLTDL